MDKKTQLLQKLTQRLGLPQELAPGVPLIELRGDSELSVQNHRGLLAYEDDCVCVNTGIGCVRVCGSNLRVFLMNRDQIVVSGRLRSVSLPEGEI